MMVAAFLFAAADDAPAGSGAARFGDDGMLTFVMLVVVKENYHPVFDAFQLVGARGI